MTIYIYLHRNGGFPNIHEKSTLVFSHGDTVLEIRDGGIDNIVREYDVKDIFRIEIKMETE